MALILFLLGYYLVWFSTLYFVNQHHAYLPLLVSIFISACQSIYLKYTFKLKFVLQFVMFFSFIGFFVDTILSRTGVLSFHINPWMNYSAPPWILGLWINFGILCVGLVDLLKRLSPYLWLIALIGFPFAYYAGAQFNAVTFNYGVWSLALLGIIWMILLPTVLKRFLWNQSLSSQ